MAWDDEDGSLFDFRWSELVTSDFADYLGRKFDVETMAIFSTFFGVPYETYARVWDISREMLVSLGDFDEASHGL